MTVTQQVSCLHPAGSSSGMAHISLPSRAGSVRSPRDGVPPEATIGITFRKGRFFFNVKRNCFVFFFNFSTMTSFSFSYLFLRLELNCAS